MDCFVSYWLNLYILYKTLKYSSVEKDTQIVVYQIDNNFIYNFFNQHTY